MDYIQLDHLQRPEDRLLQCAVEQDSLHDLIELSSELLGASVVLADSLHYIIALSSDIRSHFTDLPSWMNLIDAGFVPPVKKNMPDHHPVNRDMSDPNTHIYSENLIIHIPLPTSNDRYSCMCDIRAHGITLLKLTITSEKEISENQLRLIILLANTTLLLYNRHQVRNTSDPKSRYLLNLLNSETSLSNENMVFDFFDSDGSFKLFCFNVDNLRQYNLSFLPIVSEIASRRNMLTAQEDNTFVLLVNTQCKYSDIYEKMKTLSEQAGFPIIESIEISDISMVSDIYRIVKIAAELSAHFHNAKGFYEVNDFSMFLLFERIINFSKDEEIIHPDALTLMNYDKEKNTELAKTVYCYLLYNKEAPITADALFIHRNTLDKRLRKVESIISPNWRSVTYTFVILISLYQLLKETDSLPFYKLP